LLVGCTNAGKSTLINEFLKLDKDKKAKESEGGPTQTIDFTSYEGKNNNKTYTLYDTNGITNKGVDSIESKQKNTISEIEKRIKSHNPNNLIHCIWYCFQGSNVQPSDKDFIQSLLNIYTTYSIPIIYVHTQTYSKKQSKTCKMGIEKYLNEIFNNDKSKTEEQLKNYINILARGDEDEEKEAFGLEELEELSQKEIETKGIKSSYFEFIKQDIIPILLNGVFNLIFTDYNMTNLINNSKKSLENYLETMLNILNNDKLGLSQEVKDNDKISLNKLCNKR
jgi:tRNA U34 5-carboxymethylaminomethyl modifying GTPase MnmE/TrmE